VSEQVWARNGLFSTASDISGMTSPVRCTRCGGVYDLGNVTVTARYTDCSMWRSPCCDLLVHHRGETGWKSRGDYVRLRPW
jgi:hypothetical protein